MILCDFNDDFIIFKLNINQKIELRQKIKCAQSLLLYSSWGDQKHRKNSPT